MAIGDTKSITISESETDAQIKARVEAAFTVSATDHFITANHGGTVRIIQILGA